MGTIEVARLHDRGVQIEIVRHHGGAEDSDGDVEHAAITENLRRGDKEPLHDAEHARPRKKNFKPEANADGSYENDYQCFQKTKAPLLEEEDYQNIQRGEANAPQERDLKQQIERDGRTNHLGEIAGGNSNLGKSRSEEHTSELQSRFDLVCRLLLEKKKKK